LLLAASQLKTPLQTLLKLQLPKLLKALVMRLQTWATPLWALLKALQTLLVGLLMPLLVLRATLPVLLLVPLRMLLVQLAMPQWMPLRMLAALPSMLLRTLPRRQCNQSSQQCEKRGAVSERMRPFFMG
jgi:hypothetical protein